MEILFIPAVLLVTGLMFGSFAGAQVWRLRARQLQSEAARLAWLSSQASLSKSQAEEKEWLKQEVSARAAERVRLEGVLNPVSEDYSQCLQCHRRLRWFDLLPLISWVSTAGKCRYCKGRIGVFEPLMEIGLAIIFIASYYLWPLPFSETSGVVLFLLWLAALVVLAILFAYDLKWLLLPDSMVFLLIGLGLAGAGIIAWESQSTTSTLFSIGGAILILSGLYYLLYHISRQQWVGFGDVKLGLGLALLLADWRLALLALFLANFIGSLVVLPGMMAGKIGRKAHVPFGPFLIAGTVVAMLFGNQLINQYMALVF